ncbi:hypothetical protein [Vibrio coralliirubri]|uniref:hypothetical protein n=1 Tax=Vibrio coralliirubri TaxID=1516159 RepID=UPI0006382ECB|nr:hypothetical protein [Vibrio coralliirubri]CDU13668.1 hypothetical protein VCR17J2_540012 [Vibrio coralliirubri]
MTFFKVRITQTMVEEAIARALGLPRYDKNFKQYIQNDGDGEFTAKVDGILGEMVAEHWFHKHGFSHEDCRDQITHDYLLNGCITVEVKAKRRTVVARQNYEATVPQYVHDVQKPMAYLFISHHLRPGIDDDFTRYIDSYVVGGISRKKFDPIKRAIAQGEHDPSNNWTCTEACYNVNISQLFNAEEYAKKLMLYLS